MADRTYTVGYTVSKLGDTVDIIFNEKGYIPGQYYKDININGLNLTISGYEPNGQYVEDGTMTLAATSTTAVDFGQILITSQYPSKKINTITLYFTIDSGASLKIGQYNISSGFSNAVHADQVTVYIYNTNYTSYARISRIVVTME